MTPYNSKALSYRPLLPTGDSHIEQQGIRITSNGNYIDIINVYIPPQSSCAAGYVASLQNPMNSDDAIILGDINAHSPLWHSKLPRDSRGSQLSEEVEASSYIVLNEK